MDYKLIWWVFALPLFGSLFQALGGKIVVDTFGPKLGRRICGALGVAPIALAFLIALPMTLQLMRQPESERAVVLTLFEWISTQAISIPFEFRVDPLSMTMVLVITGIGSLIHLYSIGYMSEEPDFPRFFTYLNLFIALMLVLVLGNNLAMLFIGWEGVGLCSYLLIGFWYKDLKNSAAANKAFIVNRIGDVGLTLGMFWLVVLAAQNKDALGIVDSRWLSYDVLLPQIGQLLASKPFDATMIALLLFVGACGKSAQFPLFVWLPDAMAGPTPVSALIHAATMVTSGIVLLNRVQEIFLASPFAMNVVALVGAATALLGAGIAFGHTDIKKVLAYSTVSQLGYMFIACGVGAFYAGMFHVITHAFFKALLFLGSGAVIHAMAHDQDMRNYGRLQKYLPITYLTMGIGWAAIAGVPFLFSGFWSKEAVLYNALNMPDKMSTFTIAGLTPGAFAGWVGLAVAGMTAFYMTRMMALTFGTDKERWRDLAPAHHDVHAHHDDHHGHVHAHGDHHHGEDTEGFFMTDEEMNAQVHAHEHHHELDQTHEPHEVPWTMWAPLAILAVFSLGFVGYAMEAGHWLKDWLAPWGATEVKTAKNITHDMLTILSIVVGTTGILGAFVAYRKLPNSEGFDLSKWNPLRRAAAASFYTDWYSNKGSGMLASGVGAVVKLFDVGIIDNIVKAVGSIFGVLLSAIGKRFQTGYVRNYALMMLVGGSAIIVYALVQVIGGKF